MSSHSSERSPGKATPEHEDLKNLRDTLQDQTHLFACGGVIHINTPQETSSPIQPAHDSDISTSGNITPTSGSTDSAGAPMQNDKRISNPVVIRWDKRTDEDTHDAVCNKITLPLKPRAEPQLTRLVRDSQPATFGREGQDVYDEAYRKASKMDTADFCTSFDPYSLGIIDTIAQVLLPSVIDSTTHRAICAELYKLNVYSSPSGKFKPHVDTPRSPSQFGSLVVCLPVEHQGGQLKVWHKDLEMIFDWSNKTSDSDHSRIQWAAFYSDCKHEVLEVTSGHRLTLTYNLYAVRGSGRLTGVCPTVEADRLPLFKAVWKALSQDPFSGQGGTIGFWCSHAYAYNHETETPFPDTLKGVDAVLWEILRTLGFGLRVAPVATMDETVRENFTYWYGPDSGMQEQGFKSRRYKRPMPAELPSENIIGNKFGVHINNDLEVGGADDYDQLYTDWGEYSKGPIYWLTRPQHSELQFVYMAYGNNASTGTMYSGCAILVTMPPTKA